jgi:glycosyltransferase involved in cell wall biosynthesis
MTELPPEFAPCGPIAMVTGRYPGVSQTFIDREVLALRAMGCEVVTVTIRSARPGTFAGPFQITEAARVHRLLASARNPVTLGRALLAALRRPARLGAAIRLALMSRPKGGLARQALHAAYLAEALLLADLIRRRGIVHVHNHLGDGSGTVTMLAADLAGLPFSLTLHGPEVFEAPEVWRLDVKIARARATICISEDGRAKALRLCDPAYLDKVTVIPCGVFPEAYDGRPLGPGGRKLAFVGRLVARKGVAVLIEALARVRARGVEARLDIVGEGPERPVLETLVDERDLGAAARFHGILDGAGVAAVLRRSGLLVVPSFSEGLPVVIMEAMAGGLPVVASAVDGIPELVRDGDTGLLVPPGDPERLAQAILTLLHDPAMAGRMGEAGRSLVARRHDARRNAARLLRTILGRGPATG